MSDILAQISFLSERFFAEYKDQLAAKQVRESTSWILNQKTETINKFILTLEQRLENGFPVSVFGNTIILPNEYQKDRKMYYNEGDRFRVCTRCHSTFMVEECGLQKKAFQMICKDSDGIHYPFHIHDQQPIENLQKFKKARCVDQYNKKFSVKLYGLDVEMVYTSRGKSVARVSMVGSFGDVLVDSIVQPEDEIYDPVTKYSGLKMEDFENSKDNWISVREQILSHINKDSILVGHGLYGDLKALKIEHDKVIETSVLFTNNGRRPSLRHLTSKYLNKEIQDSGFGHCSREDAMASLELVFFGAMNPKELAPMYRNC